MKALTKKSDCSKLILHQKAPIAGWLGTLILLLTMMVQQDGRAQELRFNTHAVIASTGESLPGLGLGVEAPISKLFSTSIDANVGFHALGTAVLIKPSLNFYFSKRQAGIFVGPSLNYFSLINRKYDGERDPGTSMYGLGFNIGGKGNLSEKVNMHVVLTPQASIGSFNGVSLTANIQLGVGLKL